MSGSHSQSAPARVLKSSPNSAKQGPMKATIPMSSIVKSSSSMNKNVSPTLSPPACYKARCSPDHCGQRSPGSSLYKNKSKSGVMGGDTSIRRTASLDTIYLKGHWPRDGFHWHMGTLQIDKATQTDEADWSDSRKTVFVTESNDDKLEKLLIKQRLQRSSKESNARHTSGPGTSAMSGDHTLNTTTQTSAMYILSPTLKQNPLGALQKPLAKPTMRSSIEGLNQEIEKLVLKSLSSGGLHCMERSEDFDKFCQATPEGHRAPLADLLRSTRSKSVNTQTPNSRELTDSHQSSGCSSRDSSPVIPGYADTSPSDAGGSQSSSPDREGGRLGTSPRINRFLAREPPDGCEKVHLKSLDDRRTVTLENSPQPCTFQLKPSLGSAFKILQPNLQTSSEHDSPLVPQQQDLN